MARACFVSDLHLDSPDGARARCFGRLLENLAADRSLTHLVLLGDVFDLWLGAHEYFSSRYRPQVDALTALQSQGVEIHYFEGNHDLHLTPFWGRQLGFHVHRGPVRLELGPRRLHLEHGDEMDPDDRGYLFLRWFLRTPPMRWLILNLPGRVVAAIGERASAHSRTYTSEKKSISEAEAIEKIRSHAERVHRDAAYDLLVAGHVHVRDDYRFETARGPGRAINLGTWLESPCCLMVDEQTVELIELSEDAVAQSSARPEPAASISHE